MKIQEIGSRVIVFSYFHQFLGDTTNVVMINAEHHIFVCDTFLGPESMKPILNYIEVHGLSKKPIVIFNTHSDWDHIWGNNGLNSKFILSHKFCQKEIYLKGEESLSKLKEHQQGKVVITSPNLVFLEKIYFPEDKIEFFYTPGHTDGSASCFDHIDNILICGDNIEYPFPCLTNSAFQEYQKTLKNYLELNAIFIIPGHGEFHQNNDLIKENLAYLQEFSKMEIKFSKFTKKHFSVHLANLFTLGAYYKDRNANSKALTCYQKAIETIQEGEFAKKEQYLVEVQNNIKALKSK
ncbi:MAG: MBL fold metallo-hydrolase [Candidatus Hodarchaeales archaeon]|jgi:glyoxylase-like metal-dependent hydrolase (beta-lactamase superfamily II)